MRIRTRASVSPRQSPSSLILASISREGESPPFPSFEPLFLFFMVVSLSSWLLSLARHLRARSPDEAKRNPGLLCCVQETRIALRSIRATLALLCARNPDCAALHPGYAC